jgi:hypothetical protein
MATKNAAIAIDTSIVLDWADVAGADLYSIQVSLYPDFRVALESSDALGTSTHSFTDASEDDAKRYWRWRYSTDAGTTWSKWSEVGSYWLNTSCLTEVVQSTNTWSLADPDDPADKTVFDVYPIFKVLPGMINRVKERNRVGDLLSEYLTTKDLISLEFGEDSYVQHEQFREIVRFHNEIKTFFLIANTYDGRDNVTRIWKVQFTDDPDMMMVASGRTDLMAGSLECEEV